MSQAEVTLHGPLWLHTFGGLRWPESAGRSINTQATKAPETHVTSKHDQRLGRRDDGCSSPVGVSRQVDLHLDQQRDHPG